jgi:ketosteroid isomerase-like protein
MLDGWPEVEHRFGEEAAKRMGGSVTCENAAAFVGDEMGIVTCIEAASGLMIDGKPVTVRTRSTNVFTREGSAWKMIHHHADATLAPVSRR